MPSSNSISLLWHVSARKNWLSFIASLWPNILFRIFPRCSVCWCKAIKWRGDEMLVISSTNEFIITPICHLFGIHNIIGTQLETGEDGRYTGNYVGTPSLKEGKITRLNQWLAERGETFESYGKVYFLQRLQKTTCRCCVSWTNLSPSIRMPSWKKKPKQKVGRF